MTAYSIPDHLSLDEALTALRRETMRCAHDTYHYEDYSVQNIDHFEVVTHHIPRWPINRPDLLWDWYRQEQDLIGYGASEEEDAEVWEAARPWRLLKAVSKCDELPPFYIYTAFHDDRTFSASRQERLSDALYDAYTSVLSSEALNMLYDIDSILRGDDGDVHERTIEEYRKFCESGEAERFAPA